MKKGALLILLAVSLTFSLNAQVGINTALPDSSAALDIKSPSGSDIRGVLFPRMTSTERKNIHNPAKSLMVFDTDRNAFFYFDGRFWLSFVPAEGPAASYTGYPTDFTPKMRGKIQLDSGSVDVPVVNAPVVNGTTVNATLVDADQVTTDALNVPTFSTNALVPTGAIIMWSGSPTAIPSGWAVCDGAGGRPDLRGRFIVGYGQNGSPAPGDSNPNYTYQQTGGENQHLLSGAESGTSSHTHTSNPHQHQQMVSTSTSSGVQIEGNNTKDGSDRGWYVGWNSDYGGYHYTANTTVTVNPSAAQNATNAHENRPPFYTLVYLIKL